MADKLRLDPGELTPRDMKRARVALGGANPYALLDDPDSLFPLLIFCLKSRTDPAFTWEQAEDTPFGDFQMFQAREPDPQTAASDGNGSRLTVKNETGPKASRASAASTASRSRSTTE